MVHTIELKKRIQRTTYKAITDNDIGKILKDKRGTLHHFIQTPDSSIIIEVKRGQSIGGHIYPSLEMRLNPSKIISGNIGSGELFIPTLSNLKKMLDIFTETMNKMLPLEDCPDISTWNVSRIDCAIDIKTKHVDDYIKCWQLGDRPRNMNIKNGQTAPYPYSVSYQNKSYMLNVYDKHREREYNNPGEDNTKWVDTLRFELQILKPGLDTLMKKAGNCDRTLMSLLLDECFTAVVLEKIKSYYLCLAGQGDYYRKDSALALLKRDLRINRYMSAFRDVFDAVHKCGVNSAKRTMGKKYQDIEKRLAAYNINPVTLPRGGMRHLSSLTPVFMELWEREYESAVCLSQE